MIALRLTVLALLLAVTAGCASSSPHAGTAEVPLNEAGTVPESFPHHVLVQSVEHVQGPSLPALRAHQGETPLVHVHLTTNDEDHLPPLDDAKPPPPQLERSFAFAVFADGTRAFERPHCPGAAGVVIRQLDPAGLRRLRVFLARRCAALPPSGWDCSHSGTLEISCLSGGRRYAAQDGCEGRSKEGQRLLAFGQELAERVAVADLVVPTPKAPCPNDQRVDEEIQLTISPRRTTMWRYGPKPSP